MKIQLSEYVRKIQKYRTQVIKMTYIYIETSANEVILFIKKM